jgi:MinD superfamily P-loop ATPase
MIIAVASGKGGTGKTTVAVGLALSLPRCQFVDADAEEPNCHLFLRPAIERTIPVPMILPEVDLSRCTFCGKCAEFCQFNAMAVVKQKVLIFPELCHGCGGCVYACPEQAIQAGQRQIGEVEVGTARGMRFIQGRLKPAEPSAVRIVREEIAQLEPNGVAVVDASPGTACAVQDTIDQADFCLLVTEPTPFGLHDLKMAMDTAQEVGTPAGVIINRSGARDDLIEQECRKRDLPILLRVPFDRRIAEAYSRAEPIVDAFPEWRDRFQQVYAEIERRVNK